MSRRYRSSRQKGMSAGHARAIEHIRERARFSREVGGTDKDIEKYLYSLKGRSLAGVFDEYGREYGIDAKDYAIQTIPRWKSGQVKMSGQTAIRLFSLLPPRMPAADRLGLVKSLWIFHRVHRKAYLQFGADISAVDIGSRLKTFYDEHAQGHDIPQDFKNRFEWLSGGDSSVYEQMLNYYLEIDRQCASKAVEETIRVVQIFASASTPQMGFQHFSQTVEVDGYEVELMFNPKVEDIEISTSRPWIPSSGMEDSPWGCLTVAAIVMGLLLWWLASG